MKMPCPLTENSKKFKFTSFGGPYMSCSEATTALEMARKLVKGNKNLVVAQYKDFGYHEMDSTLKQAWENAAIGWDHPQTPGRFRDSKIAARGYFVCEKTPSTQPQEFFQQQCDEYWELLERKGQAGC